MIDEETPATLDDLLPEVRAALGKMAGAQTTRLERIVVAMLANARLASDPLEGAGWIMQHALALDDAFPKEPTPARTAVDGESYIKTETFNRACDLLGMLCYELESEGHHRGGSMACARCRRIAQSRAFLEHWAGRPL